MMRLFTHSASWTTIITCSECVKNEDLTPMFYNTYIIGGKAYFQTLAAFAKNAEIS